MRNSSRQSERLSWLKSLGRTSDACVHSPFSLHTRLVNVLADEREDAFDPNNTAIKLWKTVLLLCLLLQSVAVPYTLAFQPKGIKVVSTIFVAIALSEGVFAVDLFVRAHTGYYAHGNLIRDKRRTIPRYVFSFQFLMDIVAILPSEALVAIYPSIVPKLLLLKLLRWSRLPQFVSNLDELYTKQFVVVKLLKVLATTAYIAHVLACIRYSFGYDIDHSNHWQVENSNTTHSLHEQYLKSLFWSVGIMTGLFEGELPLHTSEFLFTILVALCGSSMFTALCTTIFVISKCESGQSEALEANSFMCSPSTTFQNICNSRLLNISNDFESHDRETAKLLCPSIANDIQVEQLKATITAISIFEGCTEQFVVAVAGLLEMTALPAQTLLFLAGDFGDAMYLVHSGVLAIIIKSIIVREIRNGSCFGELSVFSSMPRTATVVSTTYVILYKLSKFHCEKLLQGYPECAVLIAAHVQNVMDQLSTSDGNNDSDDPLFNPGSFPATRRTSIAAGIAAGASTILRVLSRRRSSSSFLSLRIDSAAWLTRKNSAGPTPEDLPNPQPARLEKRKALPVMDGGGISSHKMKGVDQAKSPKKRPSFWYTSNLFRKCIDHQSTHRKWWLLLLLLNLFYTWLLVPVQVAFPLWQRPGRLLFVADSISNAGLLIDLLMNFQLSFMVKTEKVTNSRQSAQRYLKSSFAFDLLCAFPYEYLNYSRYGLMRLPRLLRVLHLRKHLDEISYFFPINTRRQLVLLGVVFFLIFHVVTCIHFGISYIEGFNSNEEEAWISSVKLCLHRLNATHLDNCNGTVFGETTDLKELQSITGLQYSRSLYYAVGVLASPGKSVEPESSVQLIAAVILMLSGFLITGVVVDNAQKRFTASAYEQKEFFATSTRIQHFLQQQNTPLVIYQRVKSFLDFWWSSHRGAVITELVADLPRPIRLDLLRSICSPVLQTLTLLQGVRPVLSKLEEVMVENGKFILYGQGETIYRYGDHVTGVFFLLEGEVCLVEKGDTTREILRGGFFGAAALTEQQEDVGYTEHTGAPRVWAAATCEKLSNIQVQHDHKKRDHDTHSSHRVMQRMKKFLCIVYDPNSTFIKLWEMWMFAVMTVQWALVLFQTCFPLEKRHQTADTLLIFLELSFAVDIYIRSRLGFYEFGNKIMDPVRIKRKFLRSADFTLEIAALIPLYIINWTVPSYHRWDLLNVNKLLRLFKVPGQLHALEARFLKHTTELHLCKLLYYTFMLSHILGCIWFNFASREAAPMYSIDGSASRTTSFGKNHWLPSKQLEHGPHILQYMASLYWSFGLMSASSEPEFPKTTAQCVFSAVTMTTGFFLFAYVIGNFTDIIELKSYETREFDAKTRAIQKMLDHFHMPEDLQQRVKTFLLFKRYHTVTQESLLEQCLSPALLTEIRLVHLKPMIEKVEFLRGMEGTITRMLVSQFKQVLVSRGEFVCKFGDSGSDIFFIYSGVVNILEPSQNAPNSSGFRDVEKYL